jgi:hypothetical protein
MIALLWQAPWLTRRIGRAGLAFLALGAVIPLLDPLHFSLTSEDQIMFLNRDPVFAGPLPGFGLAALAAGAALLLGAKPGRTLRWAGLALAGLTGTVGCGGLTPDGAPWLAPFNAHRFAWPVLPAGHLWPIVVAVGALVLLELLPRRRIWVLAGAGVLIVGQGMTGVAGQLSLATSHPPARTAERYLEPDPLWPGRWLDIAVDGAGYSAVTRGLGSAGDTPNRTPRWNDEWLLLGLLEDPVVRRIYFEVFRHPVAHTEESGSQIRLSVRELADALVDAPGAAFLVRIDDQGRRRSYRLERMD